MHTGIINIPQKLYMPVNYNNNFKLFTTVIKSNKIQKEWQSSKFYNFLCLVAKGSCFYVTHCKI